MLHALGVGLDLHAVLGRAAAGGHQDARALDLDHADAAGVHRREVVGVAERGRVDPLRPARVEDRGRPRGRGPSSPSISTSTSRRGGSSGTAWLMRALLRHRRAWSRCTADCTALAAVWPSPQIEASRITWAISSSRASSSAAGSRSCGPATSRCSASSWRTVPTRHGTHWPHDSSRKNRAIRSTMSTRSTASLNAITTPEPSVYPPARASSNVSGMSRSSGVTNPPAAPPSRIAFSVALDAARQLEHLAQRHAVIRPRRDPGAPLSRDAEQPRPGGALRCRSRRTPGPPTRRISSTLISVSTLLIPVGLPNTPALHRERRLVPRLAALALERVEQRRLLAADVGAGAPPQLDVEREPLAHHVVAEEPVAAGLRRWRAPRRAVASGYSPRM